MTRGLAGFRLLDAPPLDPSRGEGRRQLEQELAKARYDVEPGLWDRFVEWLLGLFDASGPGLPSWVFAAVLVLGLALVALLVGLLLRPEARSRLEADHGGVLDDRGVDATAYRERAQAAVREGDWGTVLLDSYRAVVASAVERTILDELPGRTAHEASLELARAFPTEQVGLRGAADRFDAVRYGDEPGVEAEARAVLALDDRLTRTRPELSGSAPAR